MAIFEINMVAMKDPSGINIEPFNLTKESVTANGKLVVDIIRAGIRKGEITYNYMNEAEYNTLKNAVGSGVKTIRIQGDLFYGIFDSPPKYSSYTYRNDKRLFSSISLSFREV